jgi:hypothetical protein
VLDIGMIFSVPIFLCQHPGCPERIAGTRVEEEIGFHGQLLFELTYGSRNQLINDFRKTA